MSLLTKIVVPLGILLAASAAAAYLIKTKSEAEPVVVEEKSWLVSVQLAKSGAWSPSLTLYGRIESLWSVDITSAVAADVQQISVIEGDEVEKGQVLMRLDDQDARLVLVQREAELAEIKARIDAELSKFEADKSMLPREKRLVNLAAGEVERLRDLVKRQVGAQSSLDTARQAVERAAITVTVREQSIRDHQSRLAQLKANRLRSQAMRDKAEIDVQRSVIKAPFRARVAKVYVAPGRSARVGDQLVRLYDLDAMVVRAQIPARYLVEIRQAMAAGDDLVVSGRIDGQKVEAKLLRIAGEISRDTGGVEGIFKFSDEHIPLRQGRFVELGLQLPKQEGLIALPSEAIYGTDQIYRLDDENRMRALRVERIGETRSDQGRSLVLIRSDQLKPDDLLVTTQLPNALDGLLVRIPDESPSNNEQQAAL